MCQYLCKLMAITKSFVPEKKERAGCYTLINYVPGVVWLLVFSAPSSRRHGLVCSECLWHFLIILTFRVPLYCQNGVPDAFTISTVATYLITSPPSPALLHCIHPVDFCCMLHPALFLYQMYGTLLSAGTLLQS